jgi:hypothetical protein
MLQAGFERGEILLFDFHNREQAPRWIMDCEGLTAILSRLYWRAAMIPRIESISASLPLSEAGSLLQTLSSAP